MDIIEAIAPEPVTPDPVWAAGTLARIKASRVPRRRRRRLIAAGALVGVSLGAGVAVAQSVLAPDGVHHAIDAVQDRVGLRPTSEPVMIADIHLSDGTRWQVWLGLNDRAGECVASGDPGRSAVARDFDSATAYCSYMQEGGDLHSTGMLGDFAQFDFYDHDEAKGLPLVYGQVVNRKVKEVRIQGPGFEKTVKPDPETGGFGFELPFYLAHLRTDLLFDGVTVEYLAADGHVVHRGEV